MKNDTHDSRFIPGLKVKRYSPLADPQQLPIPHILEVIEISEKKMIGSFYKANEHHYPELVYVINQYIKEHNLNGK